MMITKARAKVLFSELDLGKNWSYSTDGYGYGIKHNNSEIDLRFTIEKQEKGQKIGSRIRYYFPYLTYIIKLICPEYNYPTSFDRTHLSELNREVNPDLFSFALPIWKTQWTVLKPYLHKYDTPQKLYEAELASLENDENPLWYGSSFFGMSYNIKSLILSKLIGEEQYKKRKNILIEMMPSLPDDHEAFANYKKAYLKLMEFLDDFDSIKYLKDKPWLEADSIDKNPEPIELDRTAMLAISDALSDQGIAKLCAVDTITKGDSFIAGEAAKMSFSGEAMLHMLQMTPSVIAFIPDPVVYEQIDLAQVTGEAIKFVIDEETTDSIRIDYYRDGVLMLEYLQSMGEVLEARQHPDFDLSVDDPISLIESLFAKISGRRLDSIMGEEEGLIYQLN